MGQQQIIDFENSNSARATNNYLFISRFPIPTSNPLKSYLFFGGIPNSNFQADFLELINFQIQNSKFQIPNSNFQIPRPILWN